MALRERHRAQLARDPVAESRVWKLFGLVPIMLLHRPRHTGSVGWDELRHRADEFFRGRWADLLNDAQDPGGHHMVKEGKRFVESSADRDSQGASRDVVCRRSTFCAGDPTHAHGPPRVARVGQRSQLRSQERSRVLGPCHYREGGVSSFAGHSTARFRVMGRSNGWVNQISVDGFVDRGVRCEKEGGARCQQCSAIHGGEPSVRSCYGLRGVRVGEASHPGPPGQSPDDIFSDLEAVLTRIDSSDEEALFRPTVGRHVIRKVHEEQRRLVPSDVELAASSAHHQGRVAIPRRGISHHELPSEDDVAAPTARAPRVPSLSDGALVVDMEHEEVFHGGRVARAPDTLFGTRFSMLAAADERTVTQNDEVVPHEVVSAAPDMNVRGSHSRDGRRRLLLVSQDRFVMENASDVVPTFWSRICSLKTSSVPDAAQQEDHQV